MHLRTETDRILRSNTTKWHHPHGPNKNPRSRRLAKTNQRHRSPILPRIHQFLSLLHPELLQNRKTIIGSYQKDDLMALGRTTKTRIRKTQNPNVSTTSISPTKLWMTICSAYQRIGIWRGRHTLTRGRIHRNKRHPKT